MLDIYSHSSTVWIDTQNFDRTDISIEHREYFYNEDFNFKSDFVLRIEYIRIEYEIDTFSSLNEFLKQTIQTVFWTHHNFYTFVKVTNQKILIDSFESRMI